MSEFSKTVRTSSIRLAPAVSSGPLIPPSWVARVRARLQLSRLRAWLGVVTWGLRWRPGLLSGHA